MKQTAYLAISGSIFGLVSLLHLMRILLDWNFEFGPYLFPEWVSYFGFLGAGILCIWGIGSSLKMKF